MATHVQHLRMIQGRHSGQRIPVSSLFLSLLLQLSLGNVLWHMRLEARSVEPNTILPGWQFLCRPSGRFVFIGWQLVSWGLGVYRYSLFVVRRYWRRIWHSDSRRGADQVQRPEAVRNFGTKGRLDFGGFTSRIIYETMVREGRKF
ncbi:hypothetical protein F5Y05DRAFT_34391 [Hypoxylon sp. FL0543]|nr:hypothetical protein F5Y05DRAFT_34391 [Hypoxylon sp. FL0543]